MEKSNDQWRSALELYFAVKKVYILDEEIDGELSSNIQPLKQLRDALDHFMRIEAVAQGFSELAFLSSELPDSFVDDNFKSATDHLYRAFFDVCDSASVSYREGILENLEGFSKEAILVTLPNYYPKIRPRIMEIDEEIAEMRNSKGQLPDDRTKQVNYYVDVLGELNGFYRETAAAQVSLIELREKERAQAEAEAKEQKRTRAFEALLAVGGAVIGAIAGVAATLLAGV